MTGWNQAKSKARISGRIGELTKRKKKRVEQAVEFELIRGEKYKISNLSDFMFQIKSGPFENKINKTAVKEATSQQRF